MMHRTPLTSSSNIQQPRTKQGSKKTTYSQGNEVRVVNEITGAWATGVDALHAAVNKHFASNCVLNHRGNGLPSEFAHIGHTSVGLDGVLDWFKKLSESIVITDIWFGDVCVGDKLVSRTIRGTAAAGKTGKMVKDFIGTQKFFFNDHGQICKMEAIDTINVPGINSTPVAVSQTVLELAPGAKAKIDMMMENQMQSLTGLPGFISVLVSYERDRKATVNAFYESVEAAEAAAPLARRCFSQLRGSFTSMSSRTIHEGIFFGDRVMASNVYCASSTFDYADVKTMDMFKNRGQATMFQNISKQRGFVCLGFVQTSPTTGTALACYDSHENAVAAGAFADVQEKKMKPMMRSGWSLRRTIDSAIALTQCDGIVCTGEWTFKNVAGRKLWEKISNKGNQYDGQSYIAYPVGKRTVRFVLLTTSDKFLVTNEDTKSRMDEFMPMFSALESGEVYFGGAVSPETEKAMMEWNKMPTMNVSKMVNSTLGTFLPRYSQTTSEGAFVVRATIKTKPGKGEEYERMSSEIFRTTKGSGCITINKIAPDNYVWVEINRVSRWLPENTLTASHSSTPEWLQLIEKFDAEYYVNNPSPEFLAAAEEWNKAPMITVKRLSSIMTGNPYY